MKSIIIILFLFVSIDNGIEYSNNSNNNICTKIYLPLEYFKSVDYQISLRWLNKYEWVSKKNRIYEKTSYMDTVDFNSIILIDLF